MELKKESLSMTKTIAKDKTTLYCDSDVIVPDINPDILKIIQIDALTSVTSKEKNEEKIKINGMIKLTILYIPDSDSSSVKSIVTETPYSYTIDNKKITPDCECEAEAEAERIEFSLVNSRKVYVKTSVLLSFNVWENCEIALSCGTDSEKTEAVYEPVSARLVKAFDDYQFILRERAELKSGKAPVSEILKFDVNILNCDEKAITGKCIIKGTARISVLYLDANNELDSLSCDIPFTEIAEIFDLSEDNPVSCRYRVIDYEYSIGSDSDGESRVIEFDIGVSATVSCEEFTETNIMTDCFCPGYKTNNTYDCFEFENVISCNSNHAVIKESITPDSKFPEISAVHSVTSKVTVTKATPSKGKINVEGQIEAFILYICKSNQFPVYTIKKTIPFSKAFDISSSYEGLCCGIDVLIDSTEYSLTASNDIELCFNLIFKTCLWDNLSLKMVADTDASECTADSGFIIYFVQPNDTLWNIAKKYSVSISSLIAENDIENEKNLPVGKRLIIPLC